jgi:hypothetical protein
MPRLKTYSQKIQDETKKLLKELSIRYTNCYDANVLHLLTDYRLSKTEFIRLSEKQKRELLRIKSFDEFSKNVMASLNLSLKEAKKLKTIAKMDFELIISNLSLSIFLIAYNLNRINYKSIFNPFTTYHLRSDAIKLHRDCFVLLVKSLINLWRSKFNYKLKKIPISKTKQDYLNFLINEPFTDNQINNTSNENNVLRILSYHYSIGIHLIASMSPRNINTMEIKDGVDSLQNDLDRCFSIGNRKFTGSFFHKDGFITTETKTPIDFRRIENILLKIRLSSKKGQSIYASYLLANRFINYKKTYTIEDFRKSDFQKPNIAYQKFYDYRYEFLRQYQSATKDIECDSYLKQEQYNGVSGPARSRRPLIKEIAKRLRRGE